MNGWQRRWNQARRDIDVIRRRVMGERLPSVIRDHGSTGSHISKRTAPLGRPLYVVRTVRETSEATSLYFETAGGSPISFRAGQFLSLDIAIDERPYRRAYSIAAAEGDALHITVKRVANGLVSPALINTSIGTVFSALGPSGSFGLDAHPSGLFVAGGSGITPIISMLETLLRQKDGNAVLVYANQTRSSVIFDARLDALKQKYAGRLNVVHVLERDERGEASACSRTVRFGRIDADWLQEMLDEFEAFFCTENTPSYLCGPPPMMDAIRPVLQARGGVYHEESFLSARRQTSTNSSIFSLTAAGTKIDIEAGQTLLEAGLAAGLPLPYSCAVGGCAACKVRIVRGTVDMDEPNCLRNDERDAGFVLACCSRPTSDCELVW